MMKTAKTDKTNASEKWGVYIHVPYCRSRCAYCSFVSGCDFSDMAAYKDALLSEIYARGGGKAVDSVYFGGGTPSVLERGFLAEILYAVGQSFELSSDCEISVECNPDSADGEFFEECASAGVNRASIGLQSSRDRLLKAVSRPHTFAQFIESVKAARSVGITNLNADLMLNLPGQTVHDVNDSLMRLIDFGIPHVSAYGLSVEKGTPLYESGYLPDEDRGADMYESAADILRAHGYERYEVSNFAANGKECRHNLKYWRRAPYVGLGLAAHSFDGRARSENTSDRSEYLKGNRTASRVVLSREDEIEETIMLALRTSNGLEHELLRRNCGYDLLKEKAGEIARLSRLGLVEVDSERLKLTDKAYYIMNSVIVSLI